MTGRLSLLGVATLAFATPCQAEQFDNVRDRIRQYIDRDGVPSISIAVVKGDEIVWEEGFGWADVENRIRATPHTAYMLGSVSKPITATLLMLLAERKVVGLDRPANDYLGENMIRSRLGDASRVTIRQIQAGDAHVDDVPSPPGTQDMLIHGSRGDGV
jgi:CubicO group peptidase (beta-lactamase class C family)